MKCPRCDRPLSERYPRIRAGTRRKASPRCYDGCHDLADRAGELYDQVMLLKMQLALSRSDRESFEKIMKEPAP